MVEFTSTFMEQQAALEKVLQGLFVVDDFFYSHSGKECKTPKTISAYVLPIVSVQDKPNALYFIDGKIVETPTGFVRQKTFLEKEYYHLTINGGLELVTKIAQDVLYLPVEVTEYAEPIGINKDGKFTPYKDSPFYVFGTCNFFGQLRPLLISTETENKPATRGLYVFESKLQTYTYNLEPPIAKISELLQAIKKIRPKEFKIEPIE